MAARGLLAHPAALSRENPRPTEARHLTTHPALVHPAPVVGRAEPMPAAHHRRSAAGHRTAIGTHNGPYAIYRVCGRARAVKPDRKGRARHSDRAVPPWGDPRRSWPWTCGPPLAPRRPLRQGLHVHPTIAVSEARSRCPKCRGDEGGRSSRRRLAQEDGVVTVKCAIEPAGTCRASPRASSSRSRCSARSSSSRRAACSRSS